MTEPEILETTRDLFASGHYSRAVQEAYKAVEKFVQLKAKKNRLSGTALKQNVFSAESPLLFWSERKESRKRMSKKGT